MKFNKKVFLALMLASAAAIGFNVVAKTLNTSINVQFKNINVISNGKPVTITDSSGNPAEPFIYEGTVYMPIRSVAEAVGMNVGWDGKTSTVSLSDKDAALQQTTAPQAPAAEENGFVVSEISDEIFARINGKSYKENDNIKRSDLRYLTVLHYDFNGEVLKGEIIVNKAIADDVLSIFKELYENKYQIEKMRLIDEYNADDELSMQDNNTSAFCYRTIANSNNLSNHAKGLAIDINPLINPYVYHKGDELIVSPDNALEYADRSKDFAHKLTADDICVKIFKKYGFEWGGDWETRIDYQHFEKTL